MHQWDGPLPSANESMWLTPGVSRIHLFTTGDGERMEQVGRILDVFGNALDTGGVCTAHQDASLFSAHGLTKFGLGWSFWHMRSHN